MSLARSTDPHTSHEAAESVAAKIRASQHAVWAVLNTIGPATDTELIQAYADVSERGHLFPPQSPSGIRTRRAELVRQGSVIDTGVRDILRSGRRSIVWTTVVAR